MEYVQERVTTLHDFGSVAPSAPLDRTTVLVPLAGADHATPAADRTFRTLAEVDPARVVVSVRADRSEIEAVAEWLAGFDLEAELLWCTAPRLESALAQAGLDGDAGKGRDVWLGLGLAATAPSAPPTLAPRRGSGPHESGSKLESEPESVPETEYIVVHDADATTYDGSCVPRLLFPLTRGAAFAKGYYARVEDGQLYGRLCRLFVRPLVETLADSHDAPILSYLDAFRYPLAGEFALTSELARRLRVPRGWGLEVGVLGEAYGAAGIDGSAQVDLGVHEHDHRSVGGAGGLGEMAAGVGATLFRVLTDYGVEPAYETLPERYQETARRLVDQYAADAAFNGLAYDAADEREQVRAYAEAIAPPTGDDRLPAWQTAPIEPETIAELSAAALSDP